MTFIRRVIRLIHLALSRRARMESIHYMKPSDFARLPHRKWSRLTVCDALVIVPRLHFHDSGYRGIMVVACRQDKPVHIVTIHGDVLNLGGIGGFGFRWIDGGSVPKTVPPSGWSIDCLPNGLFRLFRDKPIVVGTALSSLEIFAVDHEVADKVRKEYEC